jgi:magnesium transporter
MIEAFVVSSKGVVKELSLDSLPTTKKNEILWLNVFAPVDEDWQFLIQKLGFHHLAVEDARKKLQRTKVDEYEGFIFVSVRIFTGWEHDRHAELEELDFFVSGDTLVVVHPYAEKQASYSAETTEPQRRFVPHLSPKKTLLGIPDVSPAFLLYEYLDQVVDELFPVMDLLDEEISETEDGIYNGEQLTSLTKPLILKRQLLELRRTVAPLRDVLNHLLRIRWITQREEVRVHLQDVYDHTLRLLEQIDLHREIVAGCFEAHIAIAGNRLNQVMKMMTALSTVLMSMAIIPGIYGMNFKFIPELEYQYGYPLALFMMGVVGAIVVVFFKRIGWW